MDTVLLQTLKEIFKKFPQFWNGKNLQRSLVIDAIQQKDSQVIKALIANEKVKSIYGTEIDDVLIFDFDKLASLLKYKEYWADSFTKYRNKVGLTSEGKYLDYSSDVVLDFPFKDCVLEGGMTKEDQGKDEIYYNEVIARDEIDRLFSPKVLTNSKRYTKDGIEENITQFNNDNLIIKGNNLIALHSLKERYAGKVKLIYIDPPYNTGGDSFKYNDRFNRSSWLVFMKNRLEVAKDLLSDDGAIFISCDDNESHYLKVLSDEIFGGENFVANVIWQKKFSPQSDAKWLSDNHDHILIFAKNKEVWRPNLLPRSDETDSRYSNPDNDPRGIWASSDMSVRTYSETTDYPITTPSGRIVKPADGRCWSVSKGKFNELLSDNRIYFGKNGSNVPRIKTFLNEVQQGLVAVTIWLHNEVGNNQEAKKEINVLLRETNSTFDTPKPERLLQRILHIGSKENDIVLDYHLGSGTTCAVAHKMGRRYIGIEQMDYINEITVPRLQKVIEGEQGGISKDLDWQSGGSFVYAELMELNYFFINKIEQAQSTEDLLQFFDLMKAEANLNYQISLDKVLGAEYEIDGVDHLVSFNELELLEQRKLLIALLDKNQLYVNASEMDDANLAISESDKAFTKSFYQKDC